MAPYAALALARHARLWGILSLVNAIAWTAASALAQVRPPPGTGCRLEFLGVGKVSAILDGRSFLLDDGREIRLPGIEVPLAPHAGEAGTRAKAGGAARAGGVARLRRTTV